MHIYEKDGKKYPSVTTIIHSLGDDGLMNWANAMGFRHKKLKDIMDAAADFGTLVHSHLQSIVDTTFTEVLQPKDALQAYDLDITLNHFRRVFATIPYETIYTEKTLISEVLGYAGTLDWFALMSGKNMLNDFKTSKVVRVSMLFQLGGYYNLLTESGERVDGASIITVNTRGCQMHPIGLDNLRFLGEVFDSLAKFYLMSYEYVVKPEYEMLASLTT